MFVSLGTRGGATGINPHCYDISHVNWISFLCFASALVVWGGQPFQFEYVGIDYSLASVHEKDLTGVKIKLF